MPSTSCVADGDVVRHTLTLMARFAIDCTVMRPGMAGMGNAIWNLCEGLAQVACDDEITVLVQRDQAETFAELAPRLRIEVAGGAGVLGRLFWQNFVLPFESARYDALCFPASYAPFFLRRPSVVIVADLQYRTYPQYWSWSKRLYRHLFTRRTIRSSTIVVAISAFTASEIARDFRVTARVIPNAILVDAPGATTADVGDGKPYFLVPGSLLPHKNIRALIEAIETWPAGEPSPRFVFIGPYPATALADVVTSDRVEVRGYVSRAERDALLHSCAAVVLPSVYEGFGMPYVEGMVAGKPVVASDIPPARELLGDYAVYVAPPFDVPAIARALRAAMRDDAPIVPSAMVSALRARTAPAAVATEVLVALREAAASRPAATSTRNNSSARTP